MPLTKHTKDQQRSAYMNRTISHDEFYCWLADQIGIEVSDLPCSLEKIAASTDPHLNDIELNRWDKQHLQVLAKVPNGIPWSLSNSVCVLKAFARREVTRSLVP